jgi:hypothetical protein
MVVLKEEGNAKGWRNTSVNRCLFYHSKFGFEERGMWQQSYPFLQFRRTCARGTNTNAEVLRMTDAMQKIGMTDAMQKIKSRQQYLFVSWHLHCFSLVFARLNRPKYQPRNRRELDLLSD